MFYKMGQSKYCTFHCNGALEGILAEFIRIWQIHLQNTQGILYPNGNNLKLKDEGLSDCFC